MGKRFWNFNLEDGNHTVELEHGYFSGKREIRLDGKLLYQTAKMNHTLFDTGSNHPFQLSSHSGLVVIRTNGITFNYDLIIDGRSIETGQSVQQPQPIPNWGWIFTVSCGIIPIIALGGLIPAAIGITGAFGCANIARDLSKSIEIRISLCLGITVLCWILFILLVGASLALRG